MYTCLFSEVSVDLLFVQSDVVHSIEGASRSKVEVMGGIGYFLLVSDIQCNR